MDVSVEIHCEACGSANYSLPLEGAPADSDPIRCNDCGAPQGTIGELTAALLQQVLDHSAEALRRDLDRLLTKP